MNQNTSSKDFWKPSVLVWHGLNTNVSQIKKKKVGAWPLCFFLIVAYMIYVFHFSFDISLRKKIFFLWCHTNTHGIDLRRTPLRCSKTIIYHKCVYCRMMKNKTQNTKYVNKIPCTTNQILIWSVTELRSHCGGTIQHNGRRCPSMSHALFIWIWIFYKFISKFW